jgi:UDP-N-acetylglucosamine 1-carboxyvinyltransferase
MDIFVIEGGKELEGELKISGSKNASLPILMAALLSGGKSSFENVPDLSDTRTLLKIIEVLGAKVTTDWANNSLEIEVKDEGPIVAPYELVSTQRASFYALGALLGRRGKAKVSLPGGCVIGHRPVDIHLKGFEALGVKIEIEAGYVLADASEAKSAGIFLGGAFGSSVGATCNILMLAVTLPGITTIDNAACEPEIADLCFYLNQCGAKITGLGSPRLTIEGVERLEGVAHRMPDDRIEAATFLMLCCMEVGKKLSVSKTDLRQHGALLDVIRSLGYKPVADGKSISMEKISEAQPVECTTLPYPGFPTDCQAQLMVLLTQVPHLSVITERVYPDRFIHTAELGRMGAKIRKEGPSSFISGGTALSGAPVMASDLRASAALIMAALIADGKTQINRVYHIDRGYENIDKKLRAVGASISRETE